MLTFIYITYWKVKIEFLNFLINLKYSCLPLAQNKTISFEKFIKTCLSKSFTLCQVFHGGHIDGLYAKYVNEYKQMFLANHTRLQPSITQSGNIL